LAATSCGFVGADMFPRELQYAAGGYDLAREYGIEPEKMGELRVERLRSREGATGVFVAAKRQGGWDLTILNEDMSRAASLLDPNFSRFLGSYEGVSDFVCGKTDIGGDFAINTPGSMASCGNSSFDIATTRYCLRFQDTVNGTGVLGTEKASPMPLGSNTATLLATSEYFDSLDCSVLYAGTASPKFYMLARSRNVAGSEVVALGFPDDYLSLSSIFDGMTSLTLSASVTVTRIRGDYADQGWVTDDGIVLLLHGSRNRLARFAFGTGAELDSIRVDTEWMQGPSFDDSGEYWYYYDRGSGYVKQLRTWWR
jgi:hypothetical protein